MIRIHHARDASDIDDRYAIVGKTVIDNNKVYRTVNNKPIYANSWSIGRCSLWKRTMTSVAGGPLPRHWA